MLTQVQEGGDDVLFGGNGEDAIHAGAGDDPANAGPGNDAVFGDDDIDVLWGGVGADHLYGGFGGDYLDIKPRKDIPGFADDPAIWFEVAPAIDQDGDPATTNGADIIYGGEDADSLQADIAANGPADGDRLFDWFGAYNIDYVCASTNGAAVYSRGPAPATLAFLQVLATDDGLVDVLDAASAGSRELALVTGGNKNPPHPDTPGHFTCEGEGGSRG